MAESNESFRAPRGLVFAGLGLFLDAGLVLADYRLKSQKGDLSFSSMVFLVLVDFIIGSLLISGRFGARWFGLLRVVFGALALAGFARSQGQTADFAMQLFFSGALMILLIGKAGRARVTVGAIAAAGCLAWELVLVIKGATPS